MCPFLAAMPCILTNAKLTSAPALLLIPLCFHRFQGDPPSHRLGDAHPVDKVTLGFISQLALRWQRLPQLLLSFFSNPS